jgi:hypothetical protein
MSAHRETPLEGGRLVSPELVLVDPVLRRRLLAAAQESARTETELAATRAPTARRTAGAVSGGPEAPPAPASAPVNAPKRRISLGVVAVASTVAFVLGARLAHPSYVAPPRATPAAAPAEGAPSPWPGSTVPPGAMTLTWAPVGHAVGYEVAVYSARGRIFAAQTLTPAVDLPISVRRAAGPLTWYVWPVRAGAGSSTSTGR